MTACLAYTQSTITRGVAIEEASEPADIGLEHHVAAHVGYRQARAQDRAERATRPTARSSGRGSSA